MAVVKTIIMFPWELQYFLPGLVLSSTGRTQKVSWGLCKGPTMAALTDLLKPLTVFPSAMWKMCFTPDTCIHRGIYVQIQAQFSSVAQSCPTLWDPMDARPPCPSPTTRVYPNSCPLSQWCHPTISPSVVTFSSHLQSFPASGSFQMSQLFSSVGQSIGVSASALVLSMNTQDWTSLGWTGWISLQSKGLPRVFSNTTVQKHQFFWAQLSFSPTLTSIHDHWKNHSLD